MNDQPIKLGTEGRITIPLRMPDALAHSDSTWAIFSALMTGAIEEAMKTGDVARLLKEYDVRVLEEPRPRILNEARGDRW